MAIKPVPCFTVVCDGCGADAANGSKYSGFGPHPSDAEDMLCGAWKVRDGKHYCEGCPDNWDDDREVCIVVDTAVRIGYEAGRRDALTEAADALDAYYESEYARIKRKEGAVLYEDDMYLSGIDCSESRVRSLLTTTEGTDDD